MVNLRRARKAKVRQEAAAQADANRLAFGRSKHERTVTAAQLDQADRHLDGHRLPSAPNTIKHHDD